MSVFDNFFRHAYHTVPTVKRIIFLIHIVLLHLNMNMQNGKPLELLIFYEARFIVRWSW